jgi:autotransporter-associated beta strand protein
MKTFSPFHWPLRTLAGVALSCALAQSAFAQSGTWVNTAGGSWTNVNNWSGGVIAAGAGNTANFSTLVLPAGVTNTLDGAQTIGNLVFGDVGNAFGWTLNAGAGGPLTLAVASGSPVINVSNQTALIGVQLAGTNGLTKTGAGTLILGTSNSFSGGTFISAGTVQATNLFAMGTNTVTLGDANTGSSAAVFLVRALGAGANFGRAIVVSSNGTGPVVVGATNVVSGGGGLNFTNKITLNRDATLLVSSPGTFLNLAGGGGLAGSGNVTLVGSTLKLITSSSTFTGNLTIAPGAILQDGSASGSVDFIPNTCQVTNNGLLSMSTTAETIGGLNGVGTVVPNTANAILTVGGGNASGSFSGVMSNSTANSLGLTKTGTGVQSLSGVNTYTNATTVNGGKLLVLSPGSLAPESPVTVASGGTLGGDGTVNGPVAVLAGGNLAAGPGGLIGTLNLANAGAAALTLSNANVTCKLSADASFAADTVAIAGTLVLNGANTISLATPFGTAPAGTYTLMTFAATSGSGTFALDRFYPNATLNVTATSVTLTVTGSGTTSNFFILWKGDGTANSWDTTTANWLYNGAPTTYSDTVAVVFDDTGSASPAVSIAGTVVPGSVTANLTNKNYTIGGGAIGGANTMLAKNGPGTLTLTGTNTFGGATTIGAGTLTIAGAGQLGGGTYAGGIIDNGALRYSSSASQTLSGVVSGTGTLTQAGPGTLTLAGANTYSGGSLLSAGALYATNASALGTGTLTVGDANTGASDVSFLVIGAGNGATFSPPITVTTNGTGMVTLGATNVVSGGGGLTFSGKLTLNRDATLQVQAPGTFLNLSTSPTLAGSGNLTLKGSTLRLQAGCPGYTGNLTITSGAILQIGTANGAIDFLPDTCNVTNNGTVNLSATAETIGALQGTGIVSITAATGVLTVGGGNASGAFTGVIQDKVGGPDVIGLGKTGSGIQSLSGTNTYTGPTTITGGVLRIAGAGQLGGGFYGGAVTNNGVFEFASTVAQTVSGAFSGSGSVIQSGPGQLALFNNTYTGDTVVNGGTLELGFSTLGTNSTVSVTNGAVLQLDFADTAQVSRLVLNGVSQPPGTYNNANSAPFITGSGSLLVQPTGPTGPAVLSHSVSGGVLTLTWPAGQGWRLQGQTNALASGLGTNWTYLTDGSIATTNLPVSAGLPTVFYRLVYP